MNLNISPHGIFFSYDLFISRYTYAVQVSQNINSYLIVTDQLLKFISMDDYV